MALGPPLAVDNYWPTFEGQTFDGSDKQVSNRSLFFGYQLEQN